MDQLALKQEVIALLCDVQKRIRTDALSQRPKVRKFDVIASSSLREGFLYGQSVQRAIFYLRGHGCHWALTGNGGCLMCGHYLSTSMGEHFPSSFLVKQFADEFARYDFSDIPVICIYNAGSFLCEEEVPASARRKILEIVASNDKIKAVTIESRPEFVTVPVLEEIETILSGRKVEVGVGLELATDIYRDVCINKGFSLGDFCHCAEVISKTDVQLLTYVTVKPLFLSSSVAVEEAIKTAKLATSIGSTAISLEPTSLQSGTVVDHLYQLGAFSLPWGWDVVEVVKGLNDVGSEVRIGGFEFYPPPERCVQNCANCNGELYAAISHYNKTKDLDRLLRLDCSCSREWERIAGQENIESEEEFLGRVYKILQTC